MINVKRSNRRKKNGKIEKEENLPVKEAKIPIDMKVFWKTLDEGYFKNIDPSDINEVNHVIKTFSKYGKIFLIY
jgi:hypothetical protein